MTAEGFLAPTANPYAVAFSENMHLFAGLSGTENFFELWEEKHFSVVPISDDEDVRDAFQRTDFKLLRTAVFSNQALWDTLMERTVPRFDREGAEKYVCELLGGHGRCGMVFTSWKKYMAHHTHNKSGNHGIKSPLRVSVITNQCVNCGSTFADRPTAQNHVVSSWTTGTCRTDRSHITWALEEITLPISCNLCAQEFGDLQTYYTHVRMTHLPFPAPAIRESNPQPARQPRRHRQHSRNGHERGPTVRQKGRQQRRRGAAKAASTNRQQSQARRRNLRIDGSGGQAAQRRIQVRAEEPQQANAQGKPKNAPDNARTDLDGVGHTAGQSIEPQSRQRTETDANLRGEGATGRTMSHSRPTIRIGPPGPDGAGNRGTASASPNLRRGEILQAGHNVQSRRQENHVAHRVTGKTAPRSRSTQSNRGRAQVRTSATHSHGTRTTSVPGRSSASLCR